MHMDMLTIGCVGPNFQPGLDHLVSQYLVCAGSGWDPPVQLLIEPVLQSSSCSERSKFRFRYSQIYKIPQSESLELVHLFQTNWLPEIMKILS